MHFQVNKLLWPVKAHYFLWNAGTAPVVPFLSIYANYLGFSSFIVGIIYTVLPFSGMLAKPIAGAIADKFKCQKKIFLVHILITIVAFTSILYVPKLPRDDVEVHFSCDYSESVIDTCVSPQVRLDPQVLLRKIRNPPNSTVECQLTCQMDQRSWSSVKTNWNVQSTVNPGNISHTPFAFNVMIPLYLTDSFDMDCVYFRVAKVNLSDGRSMAPKCPSSKDKISSNCTIHCDSDFVNDVLPKISDDEVHLQYQFWLFLGLMIVGWIGQAVVVSVSDAVCFELLGNEPNKYGRQRSFGALGWGIFSIIAGLVLDTGTGKEKNYAAAFYLSAGVLLLDFLTSLFMKCEQKYSSPQILKDVSHLFTDVRTLIFIVWCMFIGVCTGLIWNFLFWLLEDLAGEKDWIKTLEGLVMAIQCLGGELPFFFLSGWIMKRIGHVNTMSLILLTIGVRYIIYSVIVDPWYVLPVELLNGITFGLFYACMASYAMIIAPPGTATTVQGTVGALFEVGVSLGSFVGGLLFQVCGGSMTFRLFGIASLVMCLVHAAVQYFCQKWTKGESKVKETNTLHV